MGYVCSPLLRSNLGSRGEAESEQKLYNARLSEIEKDFELGRLDEVSAQAARSEEARRLIKSTELGEQTFISRQNKLFVILAAFSLPLFSIPYYYATGSHEAVLQPISSIIQTEVAPSMEDLIKIAERRLETNPDDVNGWAVVAPVYVRMRRFTDAVNAYENIMRVEGRKPEHLLKLADVYIEQERGQISNKAQSLINEVLSADPNNSIARFYTGIVALQNNKIDETRRIWEEMVEGAIGNEEWLPVIKGRIAELATLENQPQQLNLDSDVAQAIQDLSPEDRLSAIQQMVTNLAQKLEDEPNDKIGWERLIRSYLILDREDDAKLAFEKASKQFSDDTIFIDSISKLMQSNEVSSESESK